MSTGSTAPVNKPVVLPEPFSGEGNVDEWIDHFENVSAVNRWSNEEQLLWLRVRLIGRAQTVFKRLSTDTKGDVALVKAALRERFEPASKKDMYVAEFYCRRKDASEEWVEYAEDLRTLVDKAYSDLSDEAREKLALHNYLQQLDDITGFAVKQKKPATLHDAVTATLEIESYRTTTKTVGRVMHQEEEKLIGVVRAAQETLVQSVSELTERLRRLEEGQPRFPPRRSRTGTRRIGNSKELRPSEIVCWKCGSTGHYARGCAAQQGN